MYATDTATCRNAQVFSATERSRVHASVRILLIALAIAVGGCGRTALEPLQRLDAAAARDRASDLPVDRMDAPADMLPDMAMDLPPPRPDAPACVPKDEICNGVDDDCDGEVDEDQPKIPCPAGGFRFCVGGQYAECPRRCQICVPGSKRTCITTFCTFWGSQSCADDGMSFGPCKESQPPDACRDVASRMMRSRELEQCCIDNQFCCVDEFDLNGNGDHTEMLGRCAGITCDP
jgi:hypothetical protein